MTRSAPRWLDARASGRRGAHRWDGWAAWLLVAAFVVAASGLLGVHTLQRSARAADLSADLGAGPVVAAPAVAREAAPPVALVVPDLGLDTRLTGAGTGRDGTLQVPADASRAGWYVDGPAPGDLGPAIVVGHLDSRAGPGIFAGLAGLEPGDRISVRRADGTQVAFAVSEITTYAKRDFPTARIYAGDGRATLRIITCGGAFDEETGRYRSNTVVYADLVDEPAD